MLGCLVITANLSLAITATSWRTSNIVAVVGSIVVWFVFVTMYSASYGLTGKL